MEMITMGVPMVKGAISGAYEFKRDTEPRPRAALLRSSTLSFF